MSAERVPMRVTYGGRAAVAYWEGARDSLSVMLERDPGSGSMTFTRISPQCVEWIAGEPAERDRFAAALESGARYLTPGPTRARLEGDARRLHT